MKLVNFFHSFFLVFIGCSFIFVESVLAESWHFSSNLEGWSGRNCYIKHSSDDNGRLYMHPEGSDPGVVCSVNLNASDNNLLKMFIWTDCSNKNLTLYFRSNNGSIKTGPSITLSSGMNGSEYTIDLSSFSSWSDTITELRIDPSDSCGSSGNSGFIAFDYIKTDYKIVYGAISGGARDYYTESPLGNVAVRLEANNVIKTKSVYTSSNGTYQINNVVPGTYSLVGIKDGYDNFFQDGKVIKAGQTLKYQNIAMRPKPFVPTPQISASKTDMKVNETITLKCHLGSEGADRRITFFVDPGRGKLRTYSATTDRYGVASFSLTAEEDWLSKTFFACRDDDSGETSKYDANVSVSENCPPEVSISLKEDEIAHGWHVDVDISSDDRDSDYSCKYKINSGNWINTIKNGILDPVLKIIFILLCPNIHHHGIVAN